MFLAACMEQGSAVLASLVSSFIHQLYCCLLLMIALIHCSYRPTSTEKAAKDAWGFPVWGSADVHVFCCYTEQSVLDYAWAFVCLQTNKNSLSSNRAPFQTRCLLD
ncbi:hypothetical protein V6N12_020867 [Hibiscus sabdariffa]|uniref:Secreted protein n=1 Tax=Hibiscus sabdariffa TaxID=183260 RepID=A0ABR2D006_9ROSI